MKTAEVFDRASKIGSGILANQLAPVREQDGILRFAGFYAQNSLNYLLANLACLMAGVTIVPIYDTLGEEATQFAFEQT